MEGTTHDPLSFSVVIPTFNREELVPSAVKSALSQTVAPREVIVVDDGSTDQTEAALSAFHERIRYVRQDNAGVSAARNRGIRESTGSWIAFLDSDDAWAEDRLEWVRACIEASPGPSWLITDATLVDHDLSPWPGTQGFARGFGVFRDAGAEPSEFFARCLEDIRIRIGEAVATAYVGDPFALLLQGNFVQPSALVARRTALESIGGFDVGRRLAEETDLALRLAVRHDLLVLMRPLVQWRVGDHDSLVSPDNIETLIENAIRSIEEVSLIRPPDGEAARTRDEHLSRLWHRLAYTQLSNLKPGRARSSLLEARARGTLSPIEGRLLWLATWMPTTMLRLLRSLKRRLR